MEIDDMMLDNENNAEHGMEDSFYLYPHSLTQQRLDWEFNDKNEMGKNYSSFIFCIK